MFPGIKCLFIKWLLYFASRLFCMVKRKLLLCIWTSFAHHSLIEINFFGILISFSAQTEKKKRKCKKERKIKIYIFCNFFLNFIKKVVKTPKKIILTLNNIWSPPLLFKIHSTRQFNFLHPIFANLIFFMDLKFLPKSRGNFSTNFHNILGARWSSGQSFCLPDRRVCSSSNR